jgi:hypothetical protein
MIGINPAIQRTAVKLRKLLESAKQRYAPFATRPENMHSDIFVEPVASRRLNDFEIIVLRRLAQAGGKALSSKQVNEPLLLGTAILRKTLKSLHRRRLIRVQLSTLFGQRFVLSKEGRQYALEQGYIVEVHDHRNNRRGRGHTQQNWGS